MPVAGGCPTWALRSTSEPLPLSRKVKSCERKLRPRAPMRPGTAGPQGGPGTDHPSHQPSSDIDGVAETVRWRALVGNGFSVSAFRHLAARLEGLRALGQRWPADRGTRRAICRRFWPMNRLSLWRVCTRSRGDGSTFDRSQIRQARQALTHEGGHLRRESRGSFGAAIRLPRIKVIAHGF